MAAKISQGKKGMPRWEGKVIFAFDPKMHFFLESFSDYFLRVFQFSFFSDGGLMFFLVVF